MVCKKCNIEKPLLDFHNDKKSKTGKQIYCKKCVKEIQSQYYLKNRDKIIERKKKYRSTDDYKKKSKKYELKYSEIRKQRGKSFKVKFSMSIRDMLRRCYKHKGISKNKKTFDILGYDVYQFKQRIEFQFKEGMSWENYGEWEIDHKKPISKFDINSEVRIINSLCNLQPLWKKDNRTKSNKF